ncbi:two-component regulator propeller domain-containing protein [Sphingomonas sp. NFR15]|uniref:sensor histidine kinase n=1 Tax=Sphingomonas sp. NFR15 TaxID=1566282 RepID=UPI0015A1A416|nr:two-component regulator propeller domain-containing protein [Sphingomonas sp. NFR15]
MSSAAKYCVVGMLASLPSPCDALGATVQRTLQQLRHTAWTAREGAPPEIWALAQSRDGYLWLGTGSGLYQFDGARFEKFRPSKGEHLPSLNVNALLASRTGDLWIGFASGAVARLRAGHLTTFDLGMPSVPVLALAEDRAGMIWAVLGEDNRGEVARFRQGRWEMLGRSHGIPAGAATSVVAGVDGSVWVAVGGELEVLRPGATRFARVPASASERPQLKQAPDGAIWLSTGARPGLQRIAPWAAGAPPTWVLPPLSANPRAESLLFDRHGNLWGTYGSGGVFRLGAGWVDGALVANGPREKFGVERGLTSNLANPILEDREGNIWVGTNLGLDQFRETSAVVAAGLPTDSRNGFRIARGPAGAMYVTTNDALFLAGPAHTARKLAELPRRPLILHTDALGRIWIGTDRTLGIWSGAAMRDVPLPWARPKPFALLEEALGRICVWSAEGAFCRKGRGWAPEQRLATLGNVPTQILRDEAGRLWIAEGDRIEMVDGRKRRVFFARNDLALGTIVVIAVRGQHVYAGGDFGLARFDGRRFVTLKSDVHPFLSRTAGIVETSAGDLWLNTAGGVVKIARAALDDAFEHPARPIKARVFDRDDGMPGVAQQDSWSQTAVEATDGRVWFLTRVGVAWIDPKQVFSNRLPPPVIVKSLIAGRRTFANEVPLRLPKGTSNLKIAYTATSLSVPSRVQFRYQLEGIDEDWIDAGTRREAFYTGLAPGNYRFRLMAANEDGVWNRQGATLSFEIPPTFVQSWPFRLLCGFGVLVLLWFLYTLRLRAMSNRIRARAAERTAERERIARELHDTLLQSIQTLTLHVQAAVEDLPQGTPERAQLENALTRADRAISEGRDRVRDLRKHRDPEGIVEILTDIVADKGFGSATSVRIQADGNPRPLAPVALDEIVRIAGEAVANVRQHARATQLRIEIRFARPFTIRFSDDGLGIPAPVLEEGRKAHHYGLQGMRERARKMRGTLTIRSPSEGGTELLLTIPAHVAYTCRGASRWAAWRNRAARLLGARLRRRPAASGRTPID